MKTVCVRIALVAVAGLLSGGVLCRAQNWTQTSAPITNWSCVASSANGTKIVAAVNGGFIYTSTNSGSTWTQTSAPTNSWTSLAASADAGHLFAAPNAYDAFIYYSTNSGANWQPTDLGGVDGVACSADGSKVAAAWGAEVAVSTNSGATWSVLGPGVVPTGQIVTLVSSSADGSTLGVIETDGGQPPSYLVITPSSVWALKHYVDPRGFLLFTSVAISADGAGVVAAINNFIEPTPTNCGGMLTLRQIQPQPGSPTARP